MKRAISRSAVCYIGSALFLATGMVAIGDQPLHSHVTGWHCDNCNSMKIHTTPTTCTSTSTWEMNGYCQNSVQCGLCTCAVNAVGAYTCR